MYLAQVGRYNDFSPKFRDELEKKVASFGKVVQYSFDIANENPDPLKASGKKVYPSRYTLDPVTFFITDPYEDRPNKQKLKQVGLVKTINDKGEPDSFHRIRILEGSAGVMRYDLENQEDLNIVMLLELHPKLKGGKFADKTKRQIVERIDLEKVATEKRTERTSRLKALNVAQEMSDADVVQFADAMMWEHATPAENRNRVEELAETNPIFFNKLVEGKDLEYQATIKRALDARIIAFDPAEYNFLWASTQQLVVKLQPSLDKNEVQVMSDWLQTSGEKANEVYKKIKGMLKQPEKV